MCNRHLFLSASVYFLLLDYPPEKKVPYKDHLTSSCIECERPWFDPRQPHTKDWQLLVLVETLLGSQYVHGQNLK